MERIKVDTDLDAIKYLVLVSDIVDGYFADDGTYQPQFGIINVMRDFYNLCIVDCDFKKEHGDNITDVSDMFEIAEDYDFIEEFNEAIRSDGPNIDFTFGYACATAQDIINTKKTTFTYVLDGIKSLVSSILIKLSDTFTEDTIEKLSEIAAKVNNAGDFATALVDAYGESARFNEVINSGHADDNVANLADFKRVKQ